MTRVKTNMNKKGLDVNPKSKKAKMEKVNMKKKTDSKDNKAKQMKASPKHEKKQNKENNEKKKKNINKNVEKSNSQQDSKVYTKQKNVHKLTVAVDTVPCPKDIQAEISNRLLDKNERTLFVKFSRDTGPTDREILIKAFAEKVKEIRPHKNYKNINYVEFETKEQLEEMKPQIERMRTSGEKAFVDYMGDKGKKSLQGQDLKINPTKLFINGFPKGTTPLQVQPLFEKCSQVTIPKTKHGGKSYGFVLFDNESDAKAAFEASQNMKIGGADVTVVFSKIKTQEIAKSEKRPLPRDEKENQVDESPSKKQKIDKKEEQKKVEEKNDKVEDMDEDEEESEDDEEGDDEEESEDDAEEGDDADDDDAEESDDDDDE